eukprot:jgi/Mesen1/5369/ME000268S04564
MANMRVPVLLLLLAIAVAVAEAKHSPPAKPPPSPKPHKVNGTALTIEWVKKLQAAKSHKKFLDYIRNAGLVDTLFKFFDKGGNATILAPTDKALNSLPKKVKKAIRQKANLKKLVSYHFITKYHTFDDLAKLPVALQLPTLEGEPVQKWTQEKYQDVKFGPVGAQSFSQLSFIIKGDLFLRFPVAVHEVNVTLIPPSLYTVPKKKN